MASGLVSATTIAAATGVGGLKPLDKMTKQEWRQQQQHLGDSEFSGSLCPIGGGASAATTAAATRGYTSARDQQQQQQQGLGHSKEAMNKAGGRSSCSFIGFSSDGSRSAAPSRVSFESATSSLECPSTAFSSTSSSSSLSSEGPGSGSLAPGHESAAAAATPTADSLLFGSPSASSFFPRAAATDSPSVSGVLARCHADSSLPSSVSCSPIRGARLAAAAAGGSGGGSSSGAPTYGSSPLNPSPIAAAAAAGCSHRGPQRLPLSSLAATSVASGPESLTPPCPVPLSGGRNSYNKALHGSMRSLSDNVTTSQKLPGSFFGQEQLLRAISVSGAARTSMAAADVEDNDVGGLEVGEGISNDYHEGDGGDDVEINGVQGICINIAEVEQQCRDMDARNVALDGIVIASLSRFDMLSSSFSDSEPEPVRYTLTFTSSSRSGSSSGSYAGTETLSMPAPRPPSLAVGGMAAVAANAAAVARSRAAAAGLVSSGEGSKQTKGGQRRSSGGSCADRVGKFGSSRRSTSRRDEDFSDYVLG